MRVNKRRRLSLSFLCENKDEKEIGELEHESYINELGISSGKSELNINTLNDEKSNKSEKYRDKSVMNVKNLLIVDDDDKQQKQNSIAIDEKSRISHELNMEQIKLWEGIINPSIRILKNIF